jgi:hypothetical protein
MKRIITVVLMMGMCLFLHAQAQFDKGDVEIAFTGSFSSFSAKYEGYDSESSTIILISVMPGYYFSKGFSVEPEIGLMKIEDEDAATYLLGNLSYTHLLDNGKVALFGRAGYGRSNSILIPFVGSGFFRVSESFDVNVLNFGAGIKYLLTNSVVIRGELNYRSHQWSEDYWWGEKEEVTYSNTGLLIGFSIIL